MMFMEGITESFNFYDSWGAKSPAIAMWYFAHKLQKPEMLYNELQYDKGMNYKFIYPTLYLDGYYEDIVIEMTVRPRLLSDIEDTSMYYTWVKEYVLALAKELLGRVRGKFNVEGSPYTMDSAQLLSEAQQEKANLESKLIGEIFVL